MKILVTGGSGFIGSHLVTHLSNAGYEVISLSRQGKVHNLDVDLKNVTYQKGDFSDEKILNNILPEIDIVIHLAWSSIPTQNTSSFSADIETNISGSIKLLNACIDNKIKKFLFISSGGTVYGIPKQVPIKEDHPLDPISSYGIGKVCIEKYLHLYETIGGLDYSIFRVSNAYGTLQNIKKGQGIIGIFLSKIKKGEPIEIWGNGEIIRDFIYVSDLAKIITMTIDKDLKYKVYNLGYGTGYSLNDIIDKMKQVTGQDFIINYKEGRKIDVPINVLSIEKLITEIRYIPKVTLDRGIEKVWNWVNNNSNF